MNRLGWNWLIIVGALAAGEGLASASPQSVALWPFLLVLAVLVVLIGYGFRVRGWVLIAVALFGAAVYYHATVEVEQHYRDSPWLRKARRYEKTERQDSMIRREFSRRIGIGLEHSPSTADLHRAILLGDKKALSSKKRRAYIDSGTIHIFAISGLHVMIIAKVIMFFVAICMVPLRWQGVVAMPFVWAYVAMIGSPPSAVRAALMASVYFVAPIFWRRQDGLIAWSVTFIAIHLINPMQIGNVGSLFSFVVMLALIFANRLVREVKTPIYKGIVLTIVAWAAGVPIAASVFGRITPGGLIANLVLMAVAGYTVVIGFLGVLASFFLTPIARLLNNLAAISTSLMDFLADAVSRIPGASIVVPPWDFFTCMLWYIAMALVYYLVHIIRERHRTEF